MGTFSMSGTIQFAPKLVDGKATLAESFSTTTNLGSGTGPGNADGYWSKTVTIPSGDSYTFDLTALPLAAFGASGSVYFASIKHLAVVNRSDKVSLGVEAGASSGWSELGGTTVGKSGTFVVHSPVDGLPVSGSSKTVSITNDSAVVALAGDTTSGSANVTGISSTTGLEVGMMVSGPGIPVAAKIKSVTNGTTIVLTANATATATGASLNFAWPDAVVQVFLAGVLD